MLFGSKGITLKDLTFERATNLAALQLFKCGQDEVDKIIKEDLSSLLPTNDLWLVKDGEEVVALFCLLYIPFLVISPLVAMDKLNKWLDAGIGDFHLAKTLELSVVTFTTAH